MSFTVNFLLYPPEDRPSVTQLREALADVLTSHRHLGEACPHAWGVLAVACNGAGVPLTHLECPGTPRRSRSRLPTNILIWSRITCGAGVRRHRRPTDSSEGDRLCRRATHSHRLNHLLCDARGMGEFMAAWSASFRGCFATHPRPSLGRAAVYPPTVAAYGGEPISNLRRKCHPRGASCATCPPSARAKVGADGGSNVRFSP